MAENHSRTTSSAAGSRRPLRAPWWRRLWAWIVVPANVNVYLSGSAARSLPGLNPTLRKARGIAIEQGVVGVRVGHLIESLSSQHEIVSLLEVCGLSASVLKECAEFVSSSNMDTSPLRNWLSERVLRVVAVAVQNATYRNCDPDVIHLFSALLTVQSGFGGVFKERVPNWVDLLTHAQWRGAPPESVRHAGATVYQLEIHNDDFTTLDFVREILAEVLGLSEDEASDLAMLVHSRGSVAWGRLPQARAEQAAAEVTRRALTQQFPLMVTVRAVEQ